MRPELLWGGDIYSVSPLQFAYEASTNPSRLFGIPYRGLQVSASQKRMERQREHAEGLAKEWYNRAQLALQNGDEGLAKEALARRQQQVLHACLVYLYIKLYITAQPGSVKLVFK